MTLKTQGPLRFGRFEVDAGERTLTRDGVPVAISPKAFDILALLVEQPGKLRTKQDLLDAIWPDTAVEEATLGRHVSDLRRALGGDQQYIETVTRHGYRFLAETEPARPTAPVPATKRTQATGLLAIAAAVCLFTFAGGDARSIEFAENTVFLRINTDKIRLFCKLVFSVLRRT
jgi:DNA-binding winged helix-turn-helix (wHTH) protein